MDRTIRQFIGIVFGGIFAVGVGLAISWSISLIWPSFGPRISSGVAALATLSGSSSSTTPQSIGVDDTAVTGLTRIIRYTASEEEDMINETASSLPSGADGAITATAYIVKDLDTGTAVVEYNDERLQPIASLTKLVTAEIAREFIDPDMPITLTSEIMRTYGNTANFRVGETFSASDLMYPLLLVSSNDAAEAYAQSYGRAKFLKAMNDFTQRIGAFRTYFDDPSGLSPKNESTATDMAIILDWIRRNDPTIIDITQLKSKTIRNHTWVNPTHFLSWSYYLGGKNGYTDEADRTAASLFSLTPRKDTYAVVILGSSNRDADVIKLLKKVR